VSLLGIDVGTTRCRAMAFSEDGHRISMAHGERDAQRQRPRYKVPSNSAWPSLVVRSYMSCSGWGPMFSWVETYSLTSPYTSS